MCSVVTLVDWNSIKVSGWKERENSGLPSDRPALGRFKEGRLFRDEKELLLVQKSLRTGFDLVALTGGGRLSAWQSRYKGHACLFSGHECRNFSANSFWQFVARIYAAV